MKQEQIKNILRQELIEIFETCISKRANLNEIVEIIKERLINNETSTSDRCKL